MGRVHTTWVGIIKHLLCYIVFIILYYIILYCNILYYIILYYIILYYIILYYIKHLLVFLAPNIIFIGQMEKDIGRGVSQVQYLSTADQ